MRGLFDPLMEALPSLGTLAVLLIGAVRVADGSTDAGSLVSIAYLFSLLALPIRAIGWVLADLPRALAGFDRVTAGARGDRRDAVRPGRRRGRHRRRRSWACTDVGFTFDGTDAADAVRRHLRRAGRAARSPIVGPTGSGKSTLAGLLVRLVDPSDGHVLLDGVDLRRLREGEVSDQAAFVAQGTFLFDDTVRGNVTLDAPFTDDEVWAALRVAAADDFVAALPEGLDTRVGERGATLSGGQRQRLALARAVVRRPRLLVLDDATSAVDPSVEARILDALRTSDEPATVVVDRLPAGHDRAGRRGGLARAGPAARPRHARGAARRACPATPALVRAYSQAGRCRRDRSRSPAEHREEGAFATLRRGLRMMPEFRRGPAGHLRARPDRHRRPRGRPDRRPAGHRPRARPAATPTWA